MKATVNRTAEQGSVLLLAMMVLLVLGVTGLLVVNQVTGELANVGSYRLVKQSYYVSEAGLAGVATVAGSGALASQLTSDSVVEVESDGLTSYFWVFRENQFPTAGTFFDLSSWGSFGPEFATKEGSTVAPAGFAAWVSPPVDSMTLPGYSVGDYKFSRYRVTSMGFLGLTASGSETDEPEEAMRMARASFLADIVVGPVARCTDRAGR